MTTSSSAIVATYRIHCPVEQAAAMARAMAWEQTVEVVESVVSEQVRQQTVGEVLNIKHDPDGSLLVEISYPAHLASNQIGQLFNLAYGNVSLYPRVRLEHLQIPAQLATSISGPCYGINGIRELLGIYARPMLATVIKPRGESLEYYRRLATDFIAGGGDVLKDDQNLVETDFEQFRERVTGCANAVEAAAQKRGRPCLYLPHVTGTGDHLKRCLELVKSLGLDGVLLCPWIMGLGNCKQLAKDFELIYMAHPALAGTFTLPEKHGIDAAVLNGTLSRLGGADISIFPGHGGRITSGESTCSHIQHALSEPLGECLPSFPCPAGGNTLELIPEMLDKYGENSILLVGGALLAHGPDLKNSTHEYMSRIQDCYPGRMQLVNTEKQTTAPLILKSTADHGWSDREKTVYKTEQSLPHANASRTELIGKHQQQTNFELRYFELEPGGYTSHERHQHTHVIIGVHGAGHLIIEQQSHLLQEQDIAYIPPLSRHQLRNDGNKAFGFYCLVDRYRDKPMPA